MPREPWMTDDDFVGSVAEEMREIERAGWEVEIRAPTSLSLLVSGRPYVELVARRQAEEPSHG